MREHGLLTRDDRDLDIMFGPRAIRNEPRVISLFLDRYVLMDEDNKSQDKNINLELWPNATFLPIVAALFKGLRVIGIDIEYKHPTEQTIAESNDANIRRKRIIQRKVILSSTKQFIDYLQGNRKTRIKKYN